MTVEFILGRSGTGKTRYCVDAIAGALSKGEDGHRLLLLVPEQATYQAERAILSRGKVTGYHRLNVLSFNRLEYMLLGSRTATGSLSRIGRTMIVQRILRDERDRLKLLGSSAERAGLARQIAAVIEEIHRYGYGPEEIERLAVELASESELTARKFAEIALLVEQYHRFIEGKFIDPDIQLARACQRASEAEFLKGAELWVDGFSSFTGSELAMLTELMKTASASHIALCLDPERIDVEDPERDAGSVSIFSPTEQTYCELFERAKRCKLKIERPVLLAQAKRFAGSRELGHIEKEIFGGSQKKATCGPAVRVLSVANRRAEVEYVAGRICSLVRQRRCRYRDIAEVVSDLTAYEHYVEALFADYGIPVFIDRRKRLSEHPVVELVGCALEIVTSGFSQPNMFAYLKTDLVPVEREMSDLLENYCVAFGVTGSDWLRDKAWAFAGADDERFDEQRVNEIKQRVRGPLLGLARRLGAGDDGEKKIGAGQFAGAVFDFLDELKLRDTLGKWIEQATADGDIGAADEHRQFWERFVDVFDELAEAFEGCELASEDYISILTSAFSQMAMAFIPPALDQVLVGSIERSRHPDLKAVFLIGATQRQFPAPVLSDGILSDEDRTLAESAQVKLAPGRRQSVVERQYLAYIAFTRASDYLCVTYPAVDEKGGAVVRSQFVDALEAIFDNLQPESIAAERVRLEQVCSEYELEDLLCCELGRDCEKQPQDRTARLDELLAAVCADEQLGRLGQRVTGALDYENKARLSDDTISGLFGGSDAVKSSASRLGTFAACPYRYFARYVLDLKERAEFKLKPLDVGDFYHRVLDAVFKQLASEKMDIAAVEQEQLKHIVHKAIQQVNEHCPFIKNFAAHSTHNSFVVSSAAEVLEDCVTALAEMVGAGVFRPLISEVGFGTLQGQSGELGDVWIALPDGRKLNLRGRIDRLDIAQTDEGKLAVLFDYKRSARSFEWAQFYYGLDLQLVIYLLALCDSQNGRRLAGTPVGAFFLPVETGPGPGDIGRIDREVTKFARKAKGIFNGEYWQMLDSGSSGSSSYFNFYVTKNGEPYGDYGRQGVLRPGDFEGVIEFCREKVIELTQGVLSGAIDVRPYRLKGTTACKWCKYKSVCRFDWQVNEYRHLEGMDKTEVLSRIGLQDGG